MIRHYLHILFRIMHRQKGFTFIHVAGLALGLCVCFLILIWVSHELNYDRFHNESERIYRIGIDLEAGRHMRWPMTMPNLASVMLPEIPEIETSVRLSKPARTSVKIKDQVFQEDLVGHADTGFFGVFNFPIVSGDPATALKAPYSVILTESMAKKYFPDTDPLGQLLMIGGNQEYRVTGVIKDVPSQSHIQFNMLCSFESMYAENREDMENWLHIQFYTYFLLMKNSSINDVEAKFPILIDKHMGSILASMGGTMAFFLQPLTQIHLHSHLPGELSVNVSMSTVYLFSGIGLFILGIACVNFINLSTARSAMRTREVGMRKTLGAMRQGLIFQFLGESIAYSLLALCIAFILTATALPIFTSFIGHELGRGLFASPSIILGCVGLALFVGIIAGSYPAFYLSSFYPIHVLKGGIVEDHRHSRLRRSLVVFQFVVSIILIIGTMSVYRQLHFMKNKDLGFDGEQVVVIPGVNRIVKQQSLESIRSEIMSINGVVDVAGSFPLPSRGAWTGIFYPEGFTDDQPQSMKRIHVGDHFIPLMKMEITKGRNFDGNRGTESQSLIINEKAAQVLGWNNPIGKTFRNRESQQLGGGSTTMQVIGVLKDFHNESLHNEVEPLVMFYNPDNSRYLTLRIAPEQIPNTMNSIKKTWVKLAPNLPFDYFFLDDSFNRLYRNEERLGKLILYFSVVAIFIGCLGLFGLAAFVTERRTKEIGIRKVLGATELSVFGMMVKEFLILVVLAVVVACPVAYLGLKRWMVSFAYQAELNAMVFIMAGTIALTVALCTIGFQVMKASRINPARALRYE